jgi:hypothetical protein
LAKTVYETYKVVKVEGDPEDIRKREFGSATHRIAPENVEVDDTSMIFCDHCAKNFCSEDITDDTSFTGVQEFAEATLQMIMQVIRGQNLSVKQRGEILQKAIDILEASKL